jgi:hypothetical protein
VPDGTPVKRTRNSVFCAKAGTAESYDFKTVSDNFDLDYDNNTKKNYIVRGLYSSYLGLSGYTGKSGDIINIYIPNYSMDRIKDYFNVRYEDQSPYYAISDRISINELNDIINLYRGDCYICQFTHRLNRNF